jgi:uncharacterized membrane protein YgdD (TMEM256/DUF423 family)
MTEVKYEGVGFTGLLFIALLVLAILGYVSWDLLWWAFCFIPLIAIGIIAFCGVLYVLWRLRE